MEECSTRARVKPTSHSKTGVTLRYAYLSQRGYYPEDLYKANQDSYVVLPNYNGVKGDILLGVFDGHGRDGDGCSGFVRKNIGPQLSQALKKGCTVSEGLRNAYVNLNKMLHACTQQRQDPSGLFARRRQPPLPAATDALMSSMPLVQC